MTDIPDKAVEAALDAYYPGQYWRPLEGIEEMRAALAAAQPHMGGEPVAWQWWYCGDWMTVTASDVNDPEAYARRRAEDGGGVARPIYLAPPASPDVAALIEAAREVVAGADTMRSYDLPGTFRRHLNEPLYRLAKALSRLSQPGGRDDH